MTVSFIIPNYNHARYVRSAIDSALAQTYTDIEIIVVDDGSTDNSRAVLEEYGNRIRTIFQANAGLSGARNTGVAAATGDYIALLDADDAIEPAYTARMLAALTSDPGRDGVYCGFRFVDQDDCALPQVENRIVPPQDLYAAMLIDGNFWVPESLLARTACYRALGEFDTRLRSVEDWDVWLRFSRHYQIIGIPDLLVRYRVVPGSMWCNPRSNLDGRLTVLNKHLGGAPAAPGSELIHQAYASAYFRAAIEYLMVDDAESSYRCLVAAANLRPALLIDRSVYYELAVGGQARGERGNVQQLDLPARQNQLLALIERMAADPDLTRAHPPLAACKAQALWALAQLHYRSGASRSARAAWRAASKVDAALLRDRAFLAFGARTWLGAGQIARLKSLLPSGQQNRSGT
jgi:glycosyltransferase involved in cell wall biosynthesis